MSFALFSGDTDSVVPVSSTRRSLAALGLPVKTSWYPWYMAPTEREVSVDNAWFIYTSELILSFFIPFPPWPFYKYTL